MVKYVSTLGAFIYSLPAKYALKHLGLSFLEIYSLFLNCITQCASNKIYHYQIVFSQEYIVCLDRLYLENTALLHMQKHLVLLLLLYSQF